MQKGVVPLHEETIPDNSRIQILTQKESEEERVGEREREGERKRKEINVTVN